MKIKYYCVGFDIREWPLKYEATCDATVWSQDLEVYDGAIKELGLAENSLQLINLDSNEDLLRLSRYVSKRKGSILVKVELPENVVEAYNEIGPGVLPVFFDREMDWNFIGVDVCDLNGFFSILHMGMSKIKRKKLFSDLEVFEAMSLAVSANILVPAHSPFTIARLSSLKFP